jgi:predicted Fe-Mo cluster-binding NifX family protein
MMKVVISATGDTLDASVDSRFGRCAWFLFVDSETMECEAIKNENAAAAAGAGTSCAQLVLEKGVDAVISGRVGPNAHEVLKQGEVTIFIAPQDSSVRETIQKCKNKQLQQMEMKVY